ncbi:hypothetical protein INT45_002557, partial [Circinella minor]
MSDNNSTPSPSLPGSSPLSVPEIDPVVLQDEDVVMEEGPQNLHHDTMKSKYATEHIDSKKILQSAKENLKLVQQRYNAAYAHWIKCKNENATSDVTKDALTAYKEVENELVTTRDAYKVFLSVNKPEPSKNNTFVPDTLPFLQLRTDTVIWRKNAEVFDSVYDFCMQFKTVLEAHGLSLDESWERLLPMAMNKEDRSWFVEALKNKKLNWSQAENKLMDHFDTPYRKFLMMVKVWKLKQSVGEPVREYAAKFQKLRRQAGLEDGLPLVLSFWCSLLETVRKQSSVALSSRYGTQLPDNVESIIGIVIAATNDSDIYLMDSSGESKDNERSLKRRSNYQGTASKDSYESNKAPSTVNNCKFCNKPWYRGHRCEEFLQRKKQRISRMAKRNHGHNTQDNLNSDDEDENEKRLLALSLACKSSPKKDSVTRDFKNKQTNDIIFPILINNSIRTYSLLDTGASISSVDYNFCLTHKININFIKHIHKDLITKTNKYEYYIRAFDKASYIKRIGTCTLSITCNNKTIERTFEVMNLTDTDEDIYNISIGTDYMASLGLGIYGLPVNFDDHDSIGQMIESERRYNNTSELLESIEAENKLLENCPACEPDEFKSAMDYIQPYITDNQNIAKGSFCTIPESVVSLDTPPNVTAYKKPYPVPLKMMEVVDEQIKEWLDNGIIKKAPANTEWNTPLTVVKKTDAKGEVKGYRVCHDPRHINSLLKTIDRMPLPIISDLFEDLKGATIYSTLDLKSAFNSLKLNPKDAHKLSFTWRGVQYQPIGTVFGIKHVSSQFQRTMSIALDGLTFVRFFVDDIVCASQTVEEHKQHLKQVIQRLTDVNLKLNPDKCRFFQSEIYLLGFHISPKGISMDRRKLANVLEFPQPKSGKDIMRYCGLINYFRTLIPNVSTIMTPLDPLRHEKSLDNLWTNKHQQAFDNLKKALLNDTVLSYPDMNAPFSISCDASLTGIGSVLYQEIDGKIKYISFIAKSLSKSERKYSATKRELLALVFSLKRFHKYVYGSTFTLYTDHKALTYLHTQRVANLMMISWMDTILQYDFKIVHLPGIANILPDALSRLFETDSEMSNELGGDKSIMRSRVARKIQEELPKIDSGEYFTPPTQEERMKLLSHEHSKGHFGVEAMLQALKRNGIYWLNLKKDANELIQACVPCQRHNIIQKGYNPLRPVLATLPGDSWGIDLAGPFTTSVRGNHYLLVMIDIATKFYILRAIPDKSAISVASEILDVICTFGPMRKLQSDHGSEFINSLVNSIKENLGFNHALISQYHPRGNGASERAVQSAVKTIKKQINGNVAEWDMKVAPTQLFLNSKYNVRTKSTPFSLMFGRNPNDFEDFSKEKDKPTSDKINKELQNKIKFMTEVVYPAVYEQVKRVTDKQKAMFDKSHKMIDIPAGSTVMILITDKQNKLDPHYKGFYKVVRKTAAGTYVLKNEKGFIEPRNYPPSLLKVTSADIIPEDDIFYEVEAIIGHKKDPENQYLYRCRWLNYDDSHDTWEPADNFTDPKFITEYWRRIGEIPESTKAINKANKKTLKAVKDQDISPNYEPVTRKRSVEMSTDR